MLWDSRTDGGRDSIPGHHLGTGMVFGSRVIDAVRRVTGRAFKVRELRGVRETASAYPLAVDRAKKVLDWTAVESDLNTLIRVRLELDQLFSPSSSSIASTVRGELSRFNRHDLNAGCRDRVPYFARPSESSLPALCPAWNPLSPKCTRVLPCWMRVPGPDRIRLPPFCASVSASVSSGCDFPWFRPRYGQAALLELPGIPRYREVKPANLLCRQTRSASAFW